MSPIERHETTSAEETAALGARLAADLARGDVVVLEGEMGAGKTTFVRGALRALGITAPVTSPTFTLGRRYDGGALPVAHLDLHRLRSLDDEDPGLLDDYVGPERLTFVEWPEAAQGELGEPAAHVRLEHGGHDARIITVERPG